MARTDVWFHRFMFVASWAFLSIIGVTAFTLANDAPLEGELNAGTDATAIQNWQYVVALVVPLIVSWLIHRTYSNQIKAAIMLVVSVIVTTVTMWLNGSLNNIAAGDYVAKVLAVIVGAIAFYYGIWRPTGVSGTIEEKMPSPLPPRETA
jgi:uncharacterized membrane protein (DUF441 family)